MGIKLDFRQEIDADLIDQEITTAGMTYIGHVARNANADALTQVAIQRLDNTTTGITIITWANGTQAFNNAWADRASLTYKHLTQ